MSNLSSREYFFFSSGMIIGLLYEGIMEILGCCGVNRLGKTKSAIGHWEHGFLLFLSKGKIYSMVV